MAKAPIFWSPGHSIAVWQSSLSAEAWGAWCNAESNPHHQSLCCTVWLLTSPIDLKLSPKDDCEGEKQDAKGEQDVGGGIHSHMLSCTVRSKAKLANGPIACHDGEHRCLSWEGGSVTTRGKEGSRGSTWDKAYWHCCMLSLVISLSLGSGFRQKKKNEFLNRPAMQVLHWDQSVWLQWVEKLSVVSSVYPALAIPALLNPHTASGEDNWNIFQDFFPAITT